MAALRAERNEKEKQLKNLNDFLGSGQKVETVLAAASKAITQFGLLSGEQYDTTNAALQTAVHCAQQKAAELCSQITELNNQMEKVWEDMQQVPYMLRAVLVHDGDASMGHYITYTFNESEQWIKFNDIDVQHVTEQQMLHDSMGGTASGKMAYCLIYTSATALPMMDGISIPEELAKAVRADNERFQEELDAWDPTRIC